MEKETKYEKGSIEEELKNIKKGSIEEELKNIKYATPLPQIDSANSQKKEEMEKVRKELENLKNIIIKKYPFTIAVSLFPPQTSDKIEEEEALTEAEKKEKPIHLLVIIPEEKFKDLQKIKIDIVDKAKNIKPRVWVHVKTPVDVWNYGLDGKYDLLSAIAMSFPLHDKGFLGGLRVAEIHKTLVLRKFERYVVSYVIAGSLVRGEATKTSDVDIYVIIDDTDVKRMPRLELKEKLRGIIYSYVIEASELAGVKNKLSPQIYILTDFWESVKDAHPVIFTFIRDGVPLYDRGTFMPWKLLLKMGKLKPSPEAIDMFMSLGDKTKETIKRRLLDIAIGDVYWGIITPSQALLMLYGLAPPTPRETVAEFKKVFVEKEKMLEKKYVDILDNIISLYKDYEHEKVKEVSGAQIDKLLADVDIYMKRLKELREQIEKRANEKTIEQIYDDIFQLLKGAFGNKSEEQLISDFDKEFIKKGKLPLAYLKTLKEIVKVRKDFKKGKVSRQEVEDARKNASLIITHLIEYNQRSELLKMERKRIIIKSGNKTYEIVPTKEKIFLLSAGKISKINLKKYEIETSDINEFNDALSNQQKDEKVELTKELFDLLENNIGKFEILI